MKFINDQWTIEIEALGYKPVGDQLAKMILLAEPPFAIGVNGKWGSGKTSLMRYAMARIGGLPLQFSIPGQTEHPTKEISDNCLKKWDVISDSDEVRKFFASVGQEKSTAKNPVCCVWFNPWQYQNDPNPLIPLLHEIRIQFGNWLKIRRKFSKPMYVSMEAGVELLAKLAESALGLGGMTGKIRGMVEHSGKQNLAVPTDAQRFNLLFEKAVELLLGKKKKQPGRLVIFVDDLDRCEEKKLLHLLEAIKLYLSSKRCIFVLGNDRAAVERAIARVWDKSSPHEAQEYVEKLFQAMVNVPICQNYAKFISQRLMQSGTWKEEAVVKPDSPLVRALSDVLEPNPRKVKNFLNSLCVAWQIANDGSLDPVQFALIHYLRCYYMGVYRLIEQDGTRVSDLIDVFALTPKDNNLVQQFFRRNFSHVLVVDEKSGSDQYKNAEESFITKMDQNTGDRKFCDLFSKSFEGSKNKKEIKEQIAALCCMTKQ